MEHVIHEVWTFIKNDHLLPPPSMFSSVFSWSERMGATAGRPALSTDNLGLLLQTTGMNKSELKEAFNNFLVTNPDGKLKLEDFQKLLGASRPDQDISKISAHCFRLLDSDNNGEIDFVEFMTANTVEAEDNSERKLEKIFNLFDGDGNGKITLKEMESLIHDFLSYFQANEMTENLPEDASVMFTKTVFSQLNKEKNDEINQEEFIELCLADDNFRSLVLSFWPENVKDFITKKIWKYYS